MYIKKRFRFNTVHILYRAILKKTAICYAALFSTLTRPGVFKQCQLGALLGEATIIWFGHIQELAHVRANPVECNICLAQFQLILMCYIRPRVSGIFHPRILKVPGTRPSLPYRTLLAIKFIIITSVMVVTFMSKNQPGDRLLNQHNIHIWPLFGLSRACVTRNHCLAISSQCIARKQFGIQQSN